MAKNRDSTQNARNRGAGAKTQRKLVLWPGLQPSKITNMITRSLRLLAAMLCVGSNAVAYPRPPLGTEDIPVLMAKSVLVCKGEVVEAPTPTPVNSPELMAQMTAVAVVRPDRCFKGTPHESSIHVLFNGFLLAGGGPAFVLRKGDYRLFFLKLQEGKYAVSNKWFGALPISRELNSITHSVDGMYLLELDLKAGLRDADPDRALDSIRMLGNMRHLHSIMELRKFLDSSDLLVKTYVWQALMRLHDYSVLPELEQFFKTQPDPPTNLLLPRDRIFAMQFELQREIMAIRDPSTLPYLETFASRGHDYRLRHSALQALRVIDSLHSAATFLIELDDLNADNGFSAMQGLLSLAGGGAIEWVPAWEQFEAAPQFYARRCREWWYAEGSQKALAHADSLKLQL